MALGGHTGYTWDRVPAEEYRVWRLCTMLHCRPSELDHESAVTLDWLLAVDDTVERAREDVRERAERGGNG